MMGPRIGGLPSGKTLAPCQLPPHTRTVLLVYLGICALLPVTILSGWYSIVTLLSFSLRYTTDRDIFAVFLSLFRAKIIERGAKEL